MILQHVFNVRADEQRLLSTWMNAGELLVLRLPNPEGRPVDRAFDPESYAIAFEPGGPAEDSAARLTVVEARRVAERMSALCNGARARRNNPHDMPIDDAWRTILPDEFGQRSQVPVGMLAQLVANRCAHVATWAGLDMNQAAAGHEDPHVIAAQSCLRRLDDTQTSRSAARALAWIPSGEIAALHRTLTNIEARNA